MIDGRNDKISVCQFFCGVPMTQKSSTPAMRNHNERNFSTFEWAIFGNSQDLRSDLQIIQGLHTRKPDRTF